MKYFLKPEYKGMTLKIAGVAVACHKSVEVPSKEAKVYEMYLIADGKVKEDKEETPKKSKKK